jgi:hypothetical protein
VARCGWRCRARVEAVGVAGKFGVEKSKWPSRADRVEGEGFTRQLAELLAAADAGGVCGEVLRCWWCGPLCNGAGTFVRGLERAEEVNCAPKRVVVCSCVCARVWWRAVFIRGDTGVLCPRRLCLVACAWVLVRWRASLVRFLVRLCGRVSGAPLPFSRGQPSAANSRESASGPSGLLPQNTTLSTARAPWTTRVVDRRHEISGPGRSTATNAPVANGRRDFSSATGGCRGK